MRGLKRNPWLFGLGLLAIPGLFGGQVLADVNNDQAGSLIIFPKVVADGERDTVIKITNRSNMPAYAHCYYTNALGTCDVGGGSCMDDGDCGTGDTCNTQCQSNNFDIFLTAQQPTFWRVSTGRFADLTQPACTRNAPCSCEITNPAGALECPGFDGNAGGGINSIAVAGTGTDFVGELRCYQTLDDQSTPVAQNSLVGEAIIETLDSGEISEYDALHFTANTVNTDNDLLINNVEYNACPEQLLFAGHNEGATMDIGGVQDVEFSTELTLVPCTALYNYNTPVNTTVNVYVYDEFEQRLSADGVEVSCVSQNRLGDTAVFGTIFDTATNNSQFMKTRIVSSDANVCLTGDDAGDACTTNADCDNYDTTPDGVALGCRPAPGVVGVVEEFYSAANRPDGHAAWSMTLSGSRSASDIIVVADPTP